MPPTVLEALRRATVAVSRSGWLGAVGMVVALLRTALYLPVQLFVAVMLQLAAASWLARHGGLPLPGLAAQGAQLALGSPRFLGIAAGLFLGAALLSAALRVAYLAGALPTLAGELSGAARQHRFAPGFTRGFLPLLPTAFLAFVAELVTTLASTGLVICGGVAASRLLAVERSGLAAASLATSVTTALLLFACTSALCDAAVCRAVLRGEGPGHAFGRAALRFGSRPAAFLAVGITTAIAGVMLGGSVDAIAALGAGAAASSSSAWLTIAPQLMAASLGALAAAFIELWRLASTAVLACHAGQQP